MWVDTSSKRRPFIGRRAQLEELTARRKAAIAGHGSIALVFGEAGSGKTRLLEEFASTLAESRTLWIRAPAITDAQKSALRAATESRLKRSTVLFIEDAHLAHHDFLDELLQIGNAVQGSRLLLIVSYRRAELERDPAAMMSLAKLARLEPAGSIEVEPLGRIEVGALARTLLGDGATPSARTMERLERLSGGNPMLLQHLVAHSVKHPNGTPASDDLPLAVNGIVAEWLQPLSEAERSILGHAALMRGPFDAADVAAVSDAPLTTVAGALRHATVLNIVSERGEGRGRYTFRHWIVAEVLERSFLPYEAQAHHARIACAIEESKTAELRVAELAEHWHEAGNDETSARYAERAGDRALAFAEYRDAAFWYERAVAMARNAGTPVHDLYAKLAEALQRVGFAFDSHQARQAAANCSEAAGEMEHAVRLRIADAVSAQLECDVSAGFGRVGSAITNGLPEASQRYAQAVAASMLALRHETEHALELLADFPCDDVGVDPAASMKYWEVTGYIALQRADPHAAREAYARVLAAAQCAADPALLIEAEANIGIYELQFSEPSCGQRLGRAAAMAQEHALPALEAYIRGYAALNDYVRGALSAARDHVRAILTLAAQTPAALVVRTYAGLSTGRALCDDALAAACARPDVVELAFRSGSPSFFGRAAGPYAQWLVDAGRIDEARAILHRCVDALRNVYGTFLTMPAVAMHADEADVTVTRHLLATAARNPHDRVSAATLALFDAVWERRRGNDSASRAAGTHAARRYSDLGWTGIEAWARELAGDRTEALRLYHQCGNLREIRRLELTRNDDGNAASNGAGVLSARERSIARLVAEGKSNRAIAATLSMSEKTVEAHLTTIFEKLGLRSRTELAASAATLRLAK
ncbi:MAG: AAA family ATPase [Candidatus Eremiobacteraeota bacterium]|nr:AAA family ATPase [Candidatus Eremiobacteraeota bacterium]